MWKVSALDHNGARRTVPVNERASGTPFKASEFQSISSPAFSRDPHLLDMLRLAVSGDQDRDFTAIESWAEQAETAARDSDWEGVPPLRRIDVALARYAQGTDLAALAGARPSCMAWHDRTGVLIPLDGASDELTIEYVPGADDDVRARQLLHRHGGSDAAVEVCLDWRAFVGRHSGVVEGRTTMQPRGRGFVATMRGATGFLVGSALRL